MRKSGQQQPLLVIIIGLTFWGILLGEERALAKNNQGLLQVTAWVKPYLQVHFLHQEQAVTVTEEDLQKGYVEIRSASQLSIKTNSPEGVRIVFLPREGPFSEIRVFGLQPLVLKGRETAVVFLHLKRGWTALDLSYRFSIPPALQPGSYGWPFSISVELM